MMAASLSLSEELFRCIICLDIFKNPVSIPCGHNFCLGCIKRFWDSRHKSECPLCKENFRTRPVLHVNVGLRDIIEQFKRSLRGQPPIKAPPRKRHPIKWQPSIEVFCNTCKTESAQLETNAVKSCLACRESYCEEHLGPHLRDPVLLKHTLTDPGTFATSHMCKHHGRLLERFCQMDQKLMCARCDRDHKHHNTVSIDMESRRIRSEMKQAEKKFDCMIQTRMQKNKEILDALELSKRIKEVDIEKSVQVYTSVIAAIERHQAALIEGSEQKQKLTEGRAEVLLNQLNQEVNEIQRRRNEMHQLELTDDPLHLIQNFSTLMATGFTNDLSNMKIHMSSSISAVRSAFSKVVDVCLELQQQLASEEVNLMTQYAVDITLDPLTAAGWLVLSADGKKVSVNPQQRRSSLPDDPKRFDSCVAVLGSQSFTTGRHYWVVQVGDKTEWDLGIAKESINRKGAITVRPDCGFWAICRRKGGCLSACTSPSISLPLSETPGKIGIYLDYEEGEVSFFDAEAKVHIYTFSECSFDEPLYPYFNPCLWENGKNAGPLIISSLETIILAGNGVP